MARLGDNIRPALGIILLAAIALGLAWLWWRHVRPRLPGSRFRRSNGPKDMIEIQLAETV